MGFIQFIEFETDDIDAFLAEVKSWEEESSDWRTATRATLCADRDHPGAYVQVVEFPSYEAAMENSNDPRTKAFAERMASITGESRKFRNLDVVKVSEF
jgi:quinol monooxygenase YgiN